MTKIIKVTQADIQKLPAEIRGNPQLMALVNTIVTTYTKLEALLGYDLQLVMEETVAEAVVTAVPAATSQAGCGCDLSKPLATPPYTAQQLKDLGNTAECPVPFGMDIRLKVFKSDGSAWQIGMLFREGLVTPVTSRSWLGHCVDFDGGRYHFIGWSTSSNPESIVRTSPEVEVHYIGTMFAWFEFRK